MSMKRGSEEKRLSKYTLVSKIEYLIFSFALGEKNIFWTEEDKHRDNNLQLSPSKKYSPFKDSFKISYTAM